MKRLSLLVVITIISVVFSGCSKKEEIAKANVELEALEKEAAELREQLSELKEQEYKMRNLAYRLESEERKTFDLEKAHYPIEKYLNHLNKGIEYYNQELAIWRKAHRDSLVGFKSSYLTLIDGRKIPAIEIKEIKDEEISILSEGSPMTLQMSELAPAVRKRLVYEADIK